VLRAELMAVLVVEALSRASFIFDYSLCSVTCNTRTSLVRCDVAGVIEKVPKRHKKLPRHTLDENRSIAETQHYHTKTTSSHTTTSEKHYG
jgi:hypothetical protein